VGAKRIHIPCTLIKNIRQLRRRIFLKGASVCVFPSEELFEKMLKSKDGNRKRNPSNDQNDNDGNEKEKNQPQRKDPKITYQ
jgi:hypothetical protein